MRTPSSLRPLRQAAGAALAGALLIAAVAPGQARDGRNAALLGGLAAGVVGGVAAGAIINGANQPPPPQPVEEYRPRRVVVEEPEEVVVRRPRGPVCHYERRKVWLNDEDFTYKRVEVCE